MTQLQDLRHILQTIDFEEVGPGLERTQALRAISYLDAIEREVSQWVACLVCGAAFPTSEAMYTHRIKRHRS